MNYNFKLEITVPGGSEKLQTYTSTPVEPRENLSVWISGFEFKITSVHCEGGGSGVAVGAECISSEAIDSDKIEWSPAVKGFVFARLP